MKWASVMYAVVHVEQLVQTPQASTACLHSSCLVCLCAFQNELSLSLLLLLLLTSSLTRNA